MRRLFLLVVLMPFLTGSSLLWVGDGANGWIDGTGDTWDAANINVIKTSVDDNDARLDAIEGVGFITKTTTTALSAEFALASLTTGILLNTTATGVPTIYAGSSCTSQFVRSLNASGVATCATVDAASVAADVATQAELDVVGADGANCAAGQFPLGVDGVNAVQSCTDAATQAELDAKSAATSTDTAVAKFTGTTGDLVNSGVLVDASNNLTVPGSLTVNGQQQGTMVFSATAPTDGVTTCGAPGEVIRIVTAVSGTCTTAPCLYVCSNDATDAWQGVALGLN